LLALEAGIDVPGQFTQALLRPQARTRKSLWLGEYGGVTSMMDLSDGLFIDLAKLCSASHVGADVQLEDIPHDTVFIPTCQKLGISVDEAVLIGGEDYGLLFTVVQEQHAQPLETAFAHEFKQGFIRLGRTSANHETNHGVRFFKNKSLYKNENSPFNHF